MNNPEKILRALDANLTSSVKLILYSKAALVLGFDSTPSAFGATMDVDAILPLAEMPKITSNDDFWDGLEKTNQDLEASGLYMTHLFSDDQVILSSDWLTDIIPISFPLKHIQLYRPCSADLVLTKMMRVDPQDRADIEFLLDQCDMELTKLKQKLSAAKIPELEEFENAFQTNLLWLTQRIGAIHEP